MAEIAYPLTAPHFLKLRVDGLSIPGDPAAGMQAPWLCRSGAWLIQCRAANEYIICMTGSEGEPLQLSFAPSTIEINNNTYSYISCITLLRDSISIDPPETPKALTESLRASCLQLSAVRTASSMNEASVTANSIKQLLQTADEALNKAFDLLSRQIGCIEEAEQAVIAAILSGNNGTVPLQKEVAPHGLQQ